MAPLMLDAFSSTKAEIVNILNSHVVNIYFMHSFPPTGFKFVKFSATNITSWSLKLQFKVENALRFSIK
jgi:hypothetical protein